MPATDLAAAIKNTLAARAADPPALEKALRGQHPVDIAEAVHGLKSAQVLQVIDALETPIAGALICELDAQTLRSVLHDAPPKKLAAPLVYARANDAVRVLGQAPPERQQQLVDAMAAESKERAERVRVMLAFNPATAGRLMTRRFVRLPEDLTTEQAFAAIHRVDLEVDTVSDIYVVDDEAPDRLVGVVSLRQLTRAEPQQMLAQIMSRNVIAVTVDSKEAEVARLIAKYDFKALPVLDRDGSLAGVVMVDDMLDVLVAKSRDDQLRFGAVEPGVLDKPYFSTPIMRVVRSRISWLVLLFVAETFTGSVLRLFEGELSQVVALSFFIPLLIGTGGNTGAQTVSTIIRGLALEEIRQRDLYRVIGRELLCGVLLGVGLGLIAFFRSRLWGSDVSLSLVVGLAILVICTWSNTIGSLIPMLAQRIKIDPALVSAPLITTLVDATGLAIYLYIAKLLLPQLR